MKCNHKKSLKKKKALHNTKKYRPYADDARNKQGWCMINAMKLKKSKKIKDHNLKAAVARLKERGRLFRERLEKELI
jgi:hypothetical protein